MALTFRTFPGGVPPLTKEAAEARIEFQQRPIDALRRLMKAEATRRVNEQEALMRTIYRDYIRYGAELIDEQQGQIEDVRTFLIDQARLLVDRDSELIDGIRDDFPLTDFEPEQPPLPPAAPPPEPPLPPGFNPPDCPPGTYYDPNTGLCTSELPPSEPPPAVPPPGVPPDCDPLRIGNSGCLDCGPVAPPPPGKTCWIPCPDDWIDFADDPAEIWERPDGTRDLFIRQAPPLARSGRKVAGPVPLLALLRESPALFNGGNPPSWRIPSGPPLPPALCPPEPPVPPPACPPCEPPEPPPPLPPGCTARLPTDLSEWDVSDERICKTVDEYLAGFAKLGDAIVTSVPDNIEAAAFLIDLLGKAAELPLIGDFLKFFVPGIQALTQVIKEVVCMLRQVKNIKSKTRGSEMIGLWFARAMVQAFERTSIGWDLGPLVRIQFQLELTQLDRITEYLVEYVFPSKIPGLPEIESMLRANVITDRHAQCLVEMNGHDWKLFDREIYSRRQRLGDDDLMAYAYRFGWDDEQIRKAFQTNAWLDERETDMFKTIREYFPPASDLIRFAVKDFWDRTRADIPEMKKELDEQKQLLDVFKAAGIKKIKYRTPEGVEQELDAPLAYWEAAYLEISPTQAYEMLHRLRANRLERYAQAIPDKSVEEVLKILPGADVRPNPNGQGSIVYPRAYSMYDVARQLKESDYKPGVRDRLAAISYRTITRVDLRRIYILGGFGPPLGLAGWDATNPADPQPIGEAEKEITEFYRDEGYADVDARRLGQFAGKDYDETVRRPEAKRLIAAACKAFKMGAISRQEAIDTVRRQHIYPQQAEAIVSLCGLDQRLADISAATSSIRKTFLRGEADDNEALSLLQEAGVDDVRRPELIRLWRIEKRGRSKQATAAMMCKWRASGLITDAEMNSRLLNVGYNQKDATNVLAHCQLGILAKDAKEQEKLIKAQRAADERRRKLDEQKEKDRLTKIIATWTDKNLRDWYRARILTADEVRGRLLLRGFTLEDANRWMTTNL